MDDDWDLQAVVRGCSAATTTTTTTSSSSFQPQVAVQENEKLFCFQDWLENTTIEELHDLYKPFFPKTSTQTTPLSPQSVPVSPLSVLAAFQDLSSQQHQIVQQKQHPVQLLQPTQPPPTSINTTASNPSTHTRCPRSKRRKNQMKRVCQVPAEGLSSDMWSWRKYGQKPIKGSPYPRGYYRCSTSKGCLARKQVERNRSDPSMLIITYTGEHNHPMPTHRNSLAGSTRQKPATSGESNKPNSSQPSSPTASLSPVTEKLESPRGEREDIMEEDDDDDFGVADIPLDEDFFSGLAEELAGPS